MTPGEAVNFGTRAIQAAIEAERDAALIIAARKTGASEREAASLLIAIRSERSQVDPDPRQDHHPDDLDKPDA